MIFDIHSQIILFVTQAKVVKKLQHPSKKAVHALSHHPSEAQLLTASENKVYFWKPKTSWTASKDCFTGRKPVFGNFPQLCEYMKIYVFEDLFKVSITTDCTNNETFHFPLIVIYLLMLAQFFNYVKTEYVLKILSIFIVTSMTFLPSATVVAGR